MAVVLTQKGEIIKQHYYCIIQDKQLSVLPEEFQEKEHIQEFINHNAKKNKHLRPSWLT